MQNCPCICSKLISILWQQKGPSLKEYSIVYKTQLINTKFGQLWPNAWMCRLVHFDTGIFNSVNTLILNWINQVSFAATHYASSISIGRWFRCGKHEILGTGHLFCLIWHSSAQIFPNSSAISPSFWDILELYICWQYFLRDVFHKILNFSFIPMHDF